MAILEWADGRRVEVDVDDRSICIMFPEMQAPVTLDGGITQVEFRRTDRLDMGRTIFEEIEK